MLFYLSQQWWKLYADFPAYQRKHGDIEVSEAPLFASVVHYYAALRGVHTWEIAEALHWPQENTKHILSSLEESTHIQHCIDVSRYLCIPRRLRDTALQRAGYHLDASQLPVLDREHVQALARLNNALTPEQTTQLDVYFRKEGGFYEAEPEPLSYDTLSTYEQARDVLHLFLHPYSDEYQPSRADIQRAQSFDVRPGLAALDKWTEHLEGEIKRAIWERLDQLLYIAYHFYELGTTRWSSKATIDAPGLDSPIALHYKTKALQTAQRLGNVTFLIKSHLERADIYHVQRRYHQSLQDVKDAVRYMALERKTLRHISPDFLWGDTDIISNLAEHSDGRLREQLYQLHSKAISIRKKSQATSLLGDDFEEDLDADDLKDEGDYSFDDWDEEMEESQQDHAGARRPWEIQDPKELESETLVFPLDRESERRFLHLVGVYQNASWERDAYDAVRIILGKGQREVAIDLLMAGLTHKQHLARAKAALMLAELKATEAVAPLIEALNDEHGRVRWSAATALGQLKNAQAVPALLAVLTSQQSKERLMHALQWDAEHQDWPLSTDNYWPDESKVGVCAAEALGEVRDARAVEPLIAVLLEHEWKDRQQATRSVGSWGHADQRLEQLIEHESKVRCQAARSLGKLGDARASETLSLVLAEEGEIARSALLALCRMRNFQTLPTLIASFDRVPPGDHTWLCIAIENMLQNHAETQAETSDLLIAALSSPSGSIRAGAAEALGRRSEISAQAALIALLDDTESLVRRRAISALVEIGTPEAVDAFISYLTRENNWQRTEVVVALGRLGDRRAVEPLVACLTNEDEALRTEAVKALGVLGDQRALEALNSMLTHNENQDMQPVIFHALCQLHDPEVYKRLCALLKKTKNGHQVRWIVRALGELGNPQAIKPLLHLMERQQGKYSGWADVPEALQKIGGRAAVEALCHLIQDIHTRKISFSVRSLEDRYRLLAHCVHALKALGDLLAVETLLPLLEDGYLRVGKEGQQSVIEALAAFKDARTVNPFIALLQREVFDKEGRLLVSFNWKIVGPMVDALGESGDPAALPILKHLSRFTGEDFFDLPRESRYDYSLYEIGRKTMQAIERLMQKPPTKEEMKQWQWVHA